MASSKIGERQNSQENLLLLAAQRQLYSEEKRKTGIWYAFSLIIAVFFLSTSVMSLLSPFGPVLAFIVLVVILVELAVLPHLREPRIIAASIQEQFDCNVLDLEWNDALTNKPDPKRIYAAVQRFYKRNDSEHPLKGLENWYVNPTIKTAPVHVARIACLKENVNWDSGQRREWVKWVSGITASFFIIVVIAGLLLNWPVKQYFSGYFLLLFPLMMAIFNHVARHNEAIKRLDHLAGVIENLQRDALREDVDIEEITRRTRYLQTEICHHRMEDVPVIDWFYKKMKSKYEPPHTDGASSLGEIKI